MSEGEDRTTNSSLKRQILITGVFPLLGVVIIGPILLMPVSLFLSWKNPKSYLLPSESLKKYSEEVFGRYTFVGIGIWLTISLGVYYWLFIRLPEIPQGLI
jgi:hypothetical protein